MNYEWDGEKRRSNIAKHGLDFEEVEFGFDWEMARYVDDPYPSERRVQAIGYLFNSVVVLVYTMRADTCRLISLRPAEPRERRAYEQTVEY